MILVRGVACSAKGNSVSVATRTRSQKVSRSASLSQSSVIQGPNTSCASNFWSANCAGGMRNSCQEANGLRKIPNAKTDPVKEKQPGERVCVPKKCMRGTTALVPDQ